MAFREVDMWEVLQILRRLGRKESRSSIKRATGARRRTIRRYEAEALKLGWSPDQGIEPDEILAGKVLAVVRPGPKSEDQSPSERLLAPLQPQLEKWLKGEPGQDRPLQLTKVLQLVKRQGIEIGYSSLRRYAVKHCGYNDRGRVTVRMADCEPGEVAEIDFGKLGIVFDPITGRNRVLHALIVTLVYSRHCYVHVTYSQKLNEVIVGLDNAWRYFGGVPRRVIVDNMKTAIIKADRYEPLFNRVFDEYAEHCGFVVDAAVARHPTGKPHVERNVPYVRENFFRGESWTGGREQVQENVIVWCTETAGMRTHGTTGKLPLVVFKNTEQPAMLPSPDERFDTPVWSDHKVHQDHHISFQKALYSVPTRYIRQDVTVRGDSGLVRIYHRGILIKIHPRRKSGGRSTDYDDYPSELTSYALRDPKRLIRNAEKHGEHVGRFMTLLLSGDFPWAKLRQGQGLLRLADKYGSLPCNQACRRSLAFDLVNVRRVKKIIEDDLASEPLPSDGKPAQIIQLPLRFERDAGSFAHHLQQEGDENAGDQTIVGDGLEEVTPVGDVADPAGPGGVCPENPPE